MSIRQSAIPGSDRVDRKPAAAVDGMLIVRAVANYPAISQVKAAGKLTDDQDATHLATVLQQQHDAGRIFVRLDLSELSMLDCAGLDVLVEAHNQFLAAGGALIMTGVGGRIARLLEITALDRTLFTVARTSDGEAASSITMSSGRSEHARSSHDRTS